MISFSLSFRFHLSFSLFRVEFLLSFPSILLDSPLFPDFGGGNEQSAGHSMEWQSRQVLKHGWSDGADMEQVVSCE